MRMKATKRFLVLAFVLVVASVLLAVPAVPARAKDTGIGINPGDTMPDFTEEMTDGSEANLSELLKDHDLVILNLFASWCGPCEREFPEMEKVYQANKDKIEIVAVSTDPDDSQEIIANYKTEHELSFPMGRMGEDLSYLTPPGVPTTIFIDKSGKVGMIQVGAFESEEEFAERVNYFLSPDYDGTPIEYEAPFTLMPYLIGGILLNFLTMLIGRIVLFRKAGKKGWHALIPFLTDYDEYALCWNGWIGIGAALLGPVAAVVGLLAEPSFIGYALHGLTYVLIIIEGIKLAKVFGKNVVFGILLGLPLINGICRMILGFGKAQYNFAASK